MSDAQKSWWDTFNAVVTGMYINPQFANSGPEYIKNQAMSATAVLRGEYPPDQLPPEL